MILFLEFSSGKVRGGEIYNARLHQFLKSRFEIIPDEVQPIPWKLRNPLRHFLLSLKTVKREKPDLIVSDISSGIRNLGAVVWMKGNKKKSLLIIQSHRLNLRWDNFLVKLLLRGIEKILVRYSDIFVVNSEYSAGLTRHKKAPPEAPVIVAHPGFETAIEEPDNKVRTTRPRGNEFDMLYVGACKEHKGMTYLIDAVRLLKDLDIRLRIAGQYEENSRYFKKIKELIARNELHKLVIFHGFLSMAELGNLYRNSSIYVHPSLMEGYGMALAEAMCYGLPIVSTTAGAIPELVENGVNGILVNPGNSEELAAAVRLLYEDASLRNTIRLNNLEKAKILNTWEDYDRKLERELIPAIQKIAGLSPIDVDSIK